MSSTSCLSASFSSLHAFSSTYQCSLDDTFCYGLSFTSLPSKTRSTSLAADASAAAIVAAGEHPAVKAYDAYVKNAVVPFSMACDDLNGLDDIGRHIVDAWEGIRTIIVLASRSKHPTEPLSTALAQYIAPTTEAIKEIRNAKLHRDYDRHQKAIMEMLTGLSWVFQAVPTLLPGSFVKETLGSAEFWTNRIRKDYKEDKKQLAFCDTLKQCIIGLVAYVEEHHKSGLTWNPKGISLAEAGLRLSDEVAEPEPDHMKSPMPKRHPTLGTVVAGGNIAGLMGELSKRKNADGTSAATGLKHVTKDQQTWRKEFKSDEPKTVTIKMPPGPPLGGGKKDDKKKKPLLGLPIFEYQDRGFKWVVENQTKDSVIKEGSSDGILTIDITDPKQQVYLYNCDGVTLKINGKFKSLILDKCTKCNVVLDTLISSTDIVNSKKIQLQVNGVCPVFSIDKTVGVLVWLSKESVAVSSFTTSLSSEMNVTFPDGEDMKELPIPEQFVHKLQNSVLKSEVSDLYH